MSTPVGESGFGQIGRRIAARTSERTVVLLQFGADTMNRDAADGTQLSGRVNDAGERGAEGRIDILPGAE